MAVKKLEKPKQAQIPPPGRARTVIKSEDRDFRYCKYCRVRVVGEKNTILHENGKTHRKKMRKLGIPITERVTLPKVRPAEVPLPFYEPIAESERYMDLDMYIDEPFVGAEYVVEVQQQNCEPWYHCVLCNKPNDPRSVLIHIPSTSHRMRYFDRHYPTMLKQLKNSRADKETKLKVLENVAMAVEMLFGRLKPLIVPARLYNEKYRPMYRRQILEGYHFSEKCGPSFADLVHTNTIETLQANVEVSAVEASKMETSSLAKMVEAPLPMSNPSVPIAEPERCMDLDKNDKECGPSFPELVDESRIVTLQAAVKRMVAKTEALERTSFRAEITEAPMEAPLPLDIPFVQMGEPKRFMDLDKYMDKPFVGLEYVVEVHREDEHDPRYHCVLCQRWANPRSILTHLPGSVHRTNYIRKHYPTVMKEVCKLRSGNVTTKQLLEDVASAVEKHHGRMKPRILWSHHYRETPDREKFHQLQILEGPHFSEENGPSFVELADKSRIEQLQADMKRTAAEADASKMETSSRSLSPMTRLRQHRQQHSDKRSRSPSLSPDICSREDVEKCENYR